MGIVTGSVSVPPDVVFVFSHLVCFPPVYCANIKNTKQFHRLLFCFCFLNNNFPFPFSLPVGDFLEAKALKSMFPLATAADGGFQTATQCRHAANLTTLRSAAIVCSSNRRYFCYGINLCFKSFYRHHVLLLLTFVSLRNMDSLPVEMILHISTFLSEKDCLALSLSGIRDRVHQNIKFFIDGIQYSGATVAFLGPTHRFLCSHGVYVGDSNVLMF